MKSGKPVANSTSTQWCCRVQSAKDGLLMSASLTKHVRARYYNGTMESLVSTTVTSTTTTKRPLPDSDNHSSKTKIKAKVYPSSINYKVIANETI